MVKVSVLVAVYNAEPYLSQCLDSLLGQTLRDIQVICVDDCSSDRSPDILQTYASKDNRVEVIRLRENRGQAHARNVGLTVARGQYVTFLDSDDWFSADALACAVEVFERCPHTDTVLFGVMRCMGTPVAFQGTPYPLPPFEVLTGKEAFELSLDWTIHGVYIARKSLYDRFPYDESCRAYSDDNTTRLHYFLSHEVRLCEGVYYYRQNPLSVTHRASVRRFDYLRANESMKRQLAELGVGAGVMRRYETVRWRVLIDLYMFYHCHGRELSRADRRYGLSELRRVWSTIERPLLDRWLTGKFGYHPMPCWFLFRVQEWLYFTLRGWQGKNQ